VACNRHRAFKKQIKIATSLVNHQRHFDAIYSLCVRHDFLRAFDFDLICIMPYLIIISTKLLKQIATSDFHLILRLEVSLSYIWTCDGKKSGVCTFTVFWYYIVCPVSWSWSLAILSHLHSGSEWD
jgi:hypothetical protein